ncbi:hypothetical protein SERLA73DRAFT_192390 [Serpula lacrymans var. lacrymans S7.3]|uniref:Uncharacterized protein n=1 Tax=Serpula lacrymans var. lacrymans (strain S7.3) TaxID=936435 RepID=F8QK87_SERL3|nr:hypothetical protein SERLA73DRAFT_192390 [Serpula lacrymans var. lacrymans S7.3]
MSVRQFLKKYVYHKNDSKIKNNRTVNECSAEEKETGATGPPPSPNPTVPWPYQWTGCVGPPDQTREGEE